MTKNTEQLLSLLSRHLSSRRNLKHVQYSCMITENSVSFFPKEEVFPSIFQRKSGDKVSVLYHCLITHLDVHILNINSIRHAYEITVPENLFVPGIYVYKLSITKVTRRWIRL